MGPKFCGKAEAWGWLIQVEEYLGAEELPDSDRLYAVEHLMRGKAATWFLGWRQKNPKANWSTFLKAFFKEFQPEVADVMAEDDQKRCGPRGRSRTRKSRRNTGDMMEVESLTLIREREIETPEPVIVQEQESTRQEPEILSTKTDETQDSLIELIGRVGEGEESSGIRQTFDQKVEVENEGMFVNGKSNQRRFNSEPVKAAMAILPLSPMGDMGSTLETATIKIRTALEKEEGRGEEKLVPPPTVVVDSLPPPDPPDLKSQVQMEDTGRRDDGREWLMRSLRNRRNRIDRLRIGLGPRVDPTQKGCAIIGPN